jgi:transcriptional regulator with XRE-family HTH domain
MGDDMKRSSRRNLVDDLADNLKTMRSERGLTQERLAEDTGLSVAYISLLERSARTAPLATVERIANAIGIAPHLLLIPAAPGAPRTRAQR